MFEQFNKHSRHAKTMTVLCQVSIIVIFLPRSRDSKFASTPLVLVAPEAGSLVV
jgi:hypothetical protein